MIRGYHVKHKRDFSHELGLAKQVADFAINHKQKHISTKLVKHINLPSTIKCQILRKYGRDKVKSAKNINLTIINASQKIKGRNGNTYNYSNFSYNKDTSIVHIKPLNIKFRWNPGRDFENINMIEIDQEKFKITASFKEKENNFEPINLLGIDLNCGTGRHIINAANLETSEVLNLGKQGPNIRKKYFKKRKKNEVTGNKESRIMKDLDHKLSRKIVDYALKNKLKIVLENLKNMRKTKTRGNGCKNINRVINSWPYYRLQQFIEYKAIENHIPVIYINPQYTSQECSYCGAKGEREKKLFICRNKKCTHRNKERNADINAAFNIGKRSLQSGGRASEK